MFKRLILVIVLLMSCSIVNADSREIEAWAWQDNPYGFDGDINEGQGDGTKLVDAEVSNSLVFASNTQVSNEWKSTVSSSTSNGSYVATGQFIVDDVDITGGLFLLYIYTVHPKNGTDFTYFEKVKMDNDNYVEIKWNALQNNYRIKGKKQLLNGAIHNIDITLHSGPMSIAFRPPTVNSIQMYGYSITSSQTPDAVFGTVKLVHQ